MCLDVAIVALTIVLIDSSTFIFLKVSVEDFVWDTTDSARDKVIEKVLKAILTLLERGFKNLLQIIIGKIVVVDFVPYWRKMNQVCEENQPGAEVFIQVVTSIAVYGKFDSPASQEYDFSRILTTSCAVLSSLYFCPFIPL